MVKPNFFIVGAPKCGTTALYSYLSGHPEVFLCEPKEPHFFGSDLHKNPEVFVLNPKCYENLFMGGDGYPIVGEGSTNYIYSLKAPDEIKQFNPSAKIVIMVREPVELLRSTHAQYLYSGNENIADFFEALSIEEVRLQGRRIPRNNDLREKVFYQRNLHKIPHQIHRFKELFGDENVKVILLDDIIKYPERTYRSLLEFLNISSSYTRSFDVVNKNKVLRSYVARDLLVMAGYSLLPIRRLISKRSLGVVNRLYDMLTIEKARPDLPEEIRVRLKSKYDVWITNMEFEIERDLSSWRLTQ